MRKIGPKVQAHVPAEHVELLDKEATRLGVGQADVIRDAIAYWVEHFATRVYIPLSNTRREGISGVVYRDNVAYLPTVPAPTTLVTNAEQR